jgi:Tfp pilus assembly protein PilX
MYDRTDTSKADPGRIAVFVVSILLLLTLLLLTFFVGFPSLSRWNARNERAQNRTQALADARNEVTITNIRIGTTAQKVKIAQQEAEVRKAQAVGIREAQDEISSTLTPLYVQFELSQALKDIAVSGKNNSVIYVPTGPNGLPIVAGAPTGGK